MKRFAFTAVAGVLYCTGLLAAPVDVHVRGTIVSVKPHTLIVRTSSGTNVSLALNGETHYLKVVPSSLDKVEPGSYIGTATKDIGATQVALGVTIFPVEMQGLNAGHFPYDQLPDTTISGGKTTTSMMTNGNVSASAAQNGVKQLTVTYNGGQQTIVVPPTAPIVNLLPGTVSDLSKGTYVFVDAAQNGNSLTAGLVAAGVGGLKPPF
jgi:hypothetical protein